MEVGLGLRVVVGLVRDWVVVVLGARVEVGLALRVEFG